MTPPIYVYATRPHYARHIQPIRRMLEDRKWDVRIANIGGEMPDPGDWCIVASGSDTAELPGRRLIYVEHGAGQTYRGDPTVSGHGYPGGPGYDDVELFICPNLTVAGLWNERYPDATTAVVGCPALDPWHTHPTSPDPDRPIIGITFHWPSSLCDEAGTAWWVYSRSIEELVRTCLRNGWGLLGHSHPRWGDQMNLNWHTLHVPVASYADVMRRATLLVADNTSMLPEFASTGRPVCFLNTPQYRRDVYHGGRFWDWPEGQVQVDDPFALVDGVTAALDDPEPVRAARQRMVDDVYAYTDGEASRRAAEAIATAVSSAADRIRSASE